MGSGAETIERLDGLHLGAGWFLTWINGVEIVYMDERVRESSFNAYLTAVEDVAKALNAPRLVLYEVSPSVLSPSVQSQWAGVIDKHRASLEANTIAAVLVSATPDTPLASVLWSPSTPHPTRVCESVADAFAWLVPHKPDTDLQETTANYETRRAQLVPRLSL